MVNLLNLWMLFYSLLKHFFIIYGLNPNLPSAILKAAYSYSLILLIKLRRLFSCSSFYTISSTTLIYNSSLISISFFMKFIIVSWLILPSSVTILFRNTCYINCRSSLSISGPDRLIAKLILWKYFLKLFIENMQF